MKKICAIMSFSTRPIKTPYFMKRFFTFLQIFQKQFRINKDLLDQLVFNNSMQVGIWY